MKDRKKVWFYEEKVTWLNQFPQEKQGISSASMFSWVVGVETSQKLKKPYFLGKMTVLGQSS